MLPTRSCIRAALFAVVALAPLPAPANSGSPTTAKVAQVSIENFAFSPKKLTVAVGTTVTWVNHDDVPHTASSSAEPPAFGSKALDADGTYSFTFTRPGTYPYYCKVHTHMTGIVIVK